jgi:uncharacterized lipoprotein YajG
MPERPSAALALLVIAAVVALLHGCAAGPQGQATTTPQACSVTLDAHDGGTITVHGDVWQDCRGSASGELHGVEASAETQSQIDSTVTAGTP